MASVGMISLGCEKNRVDAEMCIRDRARETTKRITSIGGQALIEGIMMRGPKRTEISVRMPDGTISSETLETGGLAKKYKIFRVPIFRGIAAFKMCIRDRCMQLAHRARARVSTRHCRARMQSNTAR